MQHVIQLSWDVWDALIMQFLLKIQKGSQTFNLEHITSLQLLKGDGESNMINFRSVI